MKKGMLILLVLIIAFMIYGFQSHQENLSTAENEPHQFHLGEVLPIWSALPFLGILLSIALLPLFLPRFWHHHFPKVSAFWSLVVAIPFLLGYKGPAFDELLKVAVIDYIPFIILLWALFTISGGIFVEGDLKGKPIVNTISLVIGTALASWVGTTGASMLLIRPILRANAARNNKVHIIIFFIFLISNMGGALTPFGDPPLFLGFLHGVPFFWTLRLIVPMGVVALFLLILFFIMDSILYAREPVVKRKKQINKQPPGFEIKSGSFEIETSAPILEPRGIVNEPLEKKPFRIRGLYNLIFLAGVIGGILMSGLVDLGEVKLFRLAIEKQNLLRDAILLIMGMLSFKLTPKYIRDGNDFTWAPIKEVAILFAGIFVCIVPTLEMLRVGQAGPLAFLIRAAKEPAHYFWMTGGLSSFLDNAPTYLTFLNTALGNFFPGMAEREAVHSLIAHKEIYLMAISCGAVFMGANTYIGNAPNFMVKAIAEENRIKMPSFFGYMAYSICILIPCFLLVTFIFFK